MHYKDLKYIFALFIVLATTPAYSEVSQIHFGSTGSPHEGLTISWSNQTTQDSIRWGFTESYLKGKYLGVHRTYSGKNLFDFTFPTLPSDTTIYYSIYDSQMNSWTTFKTFRTSSLTKNSFTFNAMGDSQKVIKDWRNISSSVIPGDFTLLMGDLVSEGGEMYQWDNWFDYGEEFLGKNLIYSTLGNHDQVWDAKALNYQNLLTMPLNPYGSELYYSFTYKNAVFICLNSSQASYIDQYNWLLNTLESNRDKKWKIVWFHIPFYTSPIHMGEMDYYLDT